MAKRKKKPVPPTRSNDEIRTIILQYFYDRNANATSARGKKGFSVKISNVRSELKESNGLIQREVVGNLNYLISQGWIVEEHVEKSVPLPTGTIIPQSTSYYKITAAGIDKIEGTGEFTMDKFKGIKIEATGQNIITVGDGNQVNAQFEEAAGALIELKEAILGSSELTEEQKLNAIADIDSIESQLAKSEPNGPVIKGAWESVAKFDKVLGLGAKIAAVAGFLAQFL